MNGISQGGVTSALLFNLHIEKILNDISKIKCGCFVVINHGLLNIHGRICCSKRFLLKGSFVFRVKIKITFKRGCVSCLRPEPPYKQLDFVHLSLYLKKVSIKDNKQWRTNGA